MTHNSNNQLPIQDGTGSTRPEVRHITLASSQNQPEIDSYRASHLRVLHISRQYLPGVGGLECFLACLVQEQRRQGLDVEVLTLDRIFSDAEQQLPRREVLNGIPVTRIGFSGSYKYPLAPAVLAHLDGFDVIHVHCVDSFVDLLAATKLFHRKRLVLSTHGGYFHTDFAAKLKKVYFHTVTRLSLKAFLRVYAISVNDLEIFKAICPSRQLTLMENGVDIQKYAGVSRSIGNRKLVCLGRFASNKRLDRLVDVFHLLQGLNAGYQLEIIGKDWDDSRKNCLEQIRELNLQDSVRIFVNLSDEEVRQHMADASFVVSASEYEGFGQTLIEGMSAGLLPIAANIPSFKRQLDQAQMGLVVDFEHRHRAAIEIHDYVEQALGDYRSLSWKARKAAERYSFSNVANRYIEDYVGISGETKRRLLGVEFAATNKTDLVKTLDRAVSDGNSTKLAFANANTLNTACSDPSYRKVLEDFLVVNDGIGVNIASCLKYGDGFRENLNGTDFVPFYLSESVHELRIYLLGGQNHVVEACFQRLKTEYPQHCWVGRHHGFLNNDKEHCAVRDEIKSSRANVILVAMGNPLQERWIQQHMPSTGVTLALGVGGLFDFVSGQNNRAPHWIRQSGLEWLHRLSQEPKRLWKRYLIGNAKFMFRAWSDRHSR